jgi:cytidylate kinase
MLITISREYGAGGSAVATAVAAALGWHVVDNELIEEVARRAGLSATEVERREERGPTFPERVARALAAASPELLGNVPEAPDAAEARLVRITEQVVAEAAADHAVLVGRAAAAVVGRAEGVLHVRLVAAPEYRAGIVAARLGIAVDEAERRLKDVDAHRARYHRQYYHRDWADPHHYHLVLNTGWLGIDRAAAVVVAAARSATG